MEVNIGVRSEDEDVRGRIGGGKNAAERLLFEKASSAYWRLRFAAPLTLWGVARKKEGESVEEGSTDILCIIFSPLSFKL